MQIRINTELYSGLFGMALAAVFWFNKGNIGFLSAVFPDAVLAILAAVSALLIWRGLVAGEPTFLDTGHARHVIAGVAIMALWWLGIRHVGFVTTSVPLFVGLSLMMKRREGPLSWRDVLVSVIVATVVVGGFFWIFTEVLGIRPFRAPMI